MHTWCRTKVPYQVWCQTISTNFILIAIVLVGNHFMSGHLGYVDSKSLDRAGLKKACCTFPIIY